MLKYANEAEASLKLFQAVSVFCFTLLFQNVLQALWWADAGMVCACSFPS